MKCKTMQIQLHMVGLVITIWLVARIRYKKNVANAQREILTANHALQFLLVLALSGYIYNRAGRLLQERD